MIENIIENESPKISCERLDFSKIFFLKSEARVERLFLVIFLIVLILLQVIF